MRRKFALFPLVLHSEMLQRLGRAAFPFSHGLISEVLEVLNAHSAGPETARSQIAKTVEEGGAMGKRGVEPPGESKVIQHLLSFVIRGLNEGLVEPRLAQMVDKRQASTHRRLTHRLIDH